MDIWQLADSLPAGFHDALLYELTVDYVARTASFDLAVWTPYGSGDSQAETDATRRARLVLTGVEYFAIEAPDSTYECRESRPVMLDLCDPDEAVTSQRIHSASSFAGRFFVTQWNAFIHFAAAQAELDWTEDPPDLEAPRT